MKRWIFVVALVVPLMARAESAPHVRIGQTQAEVVAILGEPEGLMLMGDRAWLTFARGTVKLENDRVIEAQLISPEAAIAKRQREQAERDRYAQTQAEEKARRMEQGWAIKLARASNPEFLAAPASYQVDFWREFQARFPEIPVRDEYERALARSEREQEQRLVQQDQENRIKELEARLQQAEQRQERYTRVRIVQPPIVFIPISSQPVVQTKYVNCTPMTLSGGVRLSTSPNFPYRNRPVGMSMAAQSGSY